MIIGEPTRGPGDCSEVPSRIWGGAQDENVFQSNCYELIQLHWCKTLVQFVAKLVHCEVRTLQININICSIEINEMTKRIYEMITR